jgi:hypothetical protein
VRSIPAPEKPGGVRKLLTIAADVLDLPDQLTDLLERADRLDAAHDTVTDPQPLPSPTVRLLDGTDPLDVVRQDAEHQAAADAANTARSLCQQGAQRQVQDMDGYLQTRGDELVAGPLRDLVADLLTAATKPAGKLARFAPYFDRDAILETGTPDELKAFQTAATLQQTFDVALAVWDRTLTQQFANGRHRTRRAHLPDGPAGFAVWQRPDLVHDDQLRDGIDQHGRRGPRTYVVDLLRIVAAPTDAGYRLATADEILDHDDQAAAAQAAEARAHAGRPRILTRPSATFH